MDKPTVTRIEVIEVNLSGVMSWSQMMALLARFAERQREGFKAAKVVVTFEKEIQP